MKSRFLVLSMLFFKIFSYAIVLFPVSIQLGQGAVPWLMGHGKILYRDIIEHRPPFTAFVVALAQSLMYGNTVMAVRLLHLIVILITIVSIYNIAFKLTNSELAACFAILYFGGLESVFDNVLFYFEIVLGLLYLIVLANLLDAENIKPRSLLLAGLFMGVSFFVKPQTVIIVGFISFWLLLVTRSWRKSLIFLIAALIPVLLVWFVYIISGLWSDYWFWNITFNQEYSGGMPAGELTTDFVRRLLLVHMWLFPFALLYWQAFRQKQAIAPLYFLLLCTTILTFIFQYPRAGEIHAAAGLPIISIIAGIVLVTVWQDRRNSVISVGLCVATLSGIGLNIAVSYIPSQAGFGDIISIGELRPVADWIDQHGLPTDTLYTLPASDSDAQLHVLTNKLPPKTWATINEYTLAYPELQNRLLTEWSQTAPTWIVFFPTMVKASFPKSAQPLIDFVNNHYSPVMTIPNLPFYGDAIIYHFNNVF